MAYPGWKLQQKIVEVLASDDRTSGYIVADNEEVTSYPYVAIGREALQNVLVSKGAQGKVQVQDLLVFLDIYGLTSEEVKMAVSNIDDAFADAFTGGTIHPEGFRVIGFPVLQDCSVEPDQAVETTDEIRAARSGFLFRLQHAP